MSILAQTHTGPISTATKVIHEAGSLSYAGSASTCSSAGCGGSASSSGATHGWVCGVPSPRARVGGGDSSGDGFRFFGLGMPTPRCRHICTKRCAGRDPSAKARKSGEQARSAEEQWHSLGIATGWATQKKFVSGTLSRAAHRKSSSERAEAQEATLSGTRITHQSPM